MAGPSPIADKKTARPRRTGRPATATLPVTAIQTTLQNMIAALAQQIQNSTDPTQTAALQARSDTLTQDLQLLTDLPSQCPDVCAAPLDTLIGLSSASMAAQL